MAAIDATLEQQRLCIAIEKQETVVEVDRLRDDHLQEAVAPGRFTRLVYRAGLPYNKLTQPVHGF